MRSLYEFVVQFFPPLLDDCSDGAIWENSIGIHTEAKEARTRAPRLWIVLIPDVKCMANAYLVRYGTGEMMTRKAITSCPANGSLAASE